MTMLHKVAETLFEGEQLRAHLGGMCAGDGHKRNTIDGKARLQAGHLIKLVEHDIGVLSTLHIDHNAHTIAVRLIIDIGNTLYLLLIRKRGNGAAQVGRVGAIRYGTDDDFVVLHTGFDFGFGTKDYATAPRLVGTLNTHVAHDVSPRGEVRTFDVVHEPFGVDVRIVDISNRSIYDFAQVVGRYIGGHTHSDTRGTVDEKRGDAGGQHRRLVARVVVVAVHVHRFLLDVLHHGFAHLAHLGFGVTHGRGAVAVHRTEVSLSDYQRIAHRPRLCHAYKCTIYRTVTMRVILTEHFTDNSSRLLRGFVVCDAHIHHTIEDAAMHRLETIAYIGQRTAHDDRHRVVNIRGFHFLFNIDRLNSFFVLNHCW